MPHEAWGNDDEVYGPEGYVTEESADDMVAEAIEPLHAEIARLTRERDEAREALQPFVAHWDPWMGAYSEDTMMSVFARTTYGDLQRAYALVQAHLAGASDD